MVVVARSLGNFGALLLSYSVALCLILVLSLGNWHFLAVLLGHRVAHFSGDLLLYLVRHIFALFLIFILGDLLVVGVALLLVLSVALLLGMTGALLSGNILAVFLRHILALLLGHLVAHLLRLAVALGRGYN